jgi:hypothetical protein
MDSNDPVGRPVTERATHFSPDTWSRDELSTRIEPADPLLELAATLVRDVPT